MMGCLCSERDLHYMVLLHRGLHLPNPEVTRLRTIELCAQGNVNGHPRQVNFDVDLYTCNMPSNWEVLGQLGLFKIIKALIK